MQALGVQGAVHLLPAKRIGERAVLGLLVATQIDVKVNKVLLLNIVYCSLASDILPIGPSLKRHWCEKLKREASYF